MKNNWWKTLGVLLILYSLLMGLLTPLRTGIVEASPKSANAGETFELNVTGYNSFYTENMDELRAWLKLDSIRALTASNVNVLNDRELALTFKVPSHLPSDREVQYATLLIDHPLDGASVLPDAVAISQKEFDSVAGEAEWPKKTISGLHEKESVVFPFRNVLYETIRNLYYHVPLWFAMFILFISAVVLSAMHLATSKIKFDQQAASLTSVGILYGVLGLITGAIWAKHTWGAYWSFDVKQNMTAIGLLIYGAYFVLRIAIEDAEKKARISAVYNIFAFATLIPLLYVIPRLTDSLHPGAGGNITFGSEDLDNTMRLVFYPAIIGWALFGVWLASLRFRTERLKHRLLYEE